MRCILLIFMLFSVGCSTGNKNLQVSGVDKPQIHGECNRLSGILGYGKEIFKGVRIKAVNSPTAGWRGGEPYSVHPSGKDVGGWVQLLSKKQFITHWPVARKHGVVVHEVMHIINYILTGRADHSKYIHTKDRRQLKIADIVKFRWYSTVDGKYIESSPWEDYADGCCFDINFEE